MVLVYQLLSDCYIAMYRKKPHSDCEMPDPTIPLRILVLNASLKRAPQRSNTEELARDVLRAMKHHGRVKAEVIRLADWYIPVGLGYREGKGDEWPSIVRTMKQSDIVIFATPIWWGQRSS